MAARYSISTVLELFSPALLSGVPDFFDRNKILSGGDLSHYQVPHCIRVLFYFVWFVFIHHNFQFYFELCTWVSSGSWAGMTSVSGLEDGMAEVTRSAGTGAPPCTSMTAAVVRPGARPTTNWKVSIEFEIWSKFWVLLFEICFNDHSVILHTPRQCKCHNVYKISLWSVEYILNQSTAANVGRISNSIEIYR